MKKVLYFIKRFIDWVCYDPLQAYKDREYADRVNRQIRERRKTDRYIS